MSRQPVPYEVDRTGRCARCGFDWDVAAAPLVAEAATIGPRCRAAMDALAERNPGVEREVVWRTRPDRSTWAPVEYLGHIRDGIEFFDRRIEQVLTEDRPELPVTIRLTDRVARGRYREEAEPVAMLAEIDAGADRARRRLEVLSAPQWQRAGIGSAGQARTVIDLARRLVHEVRHHALDIDRQAPPR